MLGALKKRTQAQPDRGVFFRVLNKKDGSEICAEEIGENRRDMFRGFGE
jgi:hypothetical protein